MRRLRALWRGDLRRSWDHRATTDPVFYSTWRPGHREAASIEQSFEEGALQAKSLLEPALARLGFDARGRHLLDVGAGYGRMFRGYASLGFAPITGAEISLEMARLGARSQPVPGARFVVTDGASLSALRSGSFDFCISRGVFAFQIDERQVLALLPEIHRVLAPDGAFLLHFGGRRPSVGRRLLRLLPVRLRAALDGPRRTGAPSAWQEVVGTTSFALPAERVVAALASVGCDDLEVLPDPMRPNARDQRYFYVLGRKSKSSAARHSARTGKAARSATSKPGSRRRSDFSAT